jgi:outer membrane murein-binding lipoprotein Lpp
MKKAHWGWKKTQLIFASMVIAATGVGIAVPAGAESLEELKATIQQLKATVNSLEQKMQTMEQKQIKTEEVISQQGAAGGTATGGLKLPANTTLSIYGYTKLDAMYTDTGGTVQPLYIPSSVPLDSEQDSLPDNDFYMHAKQTRLGFASSSTTDYGQFNVKLEGDFYGAGGNDKYSNSYGFRIRRAYGELGNLLAGQEWSTFIDLSMYPETIDFGGAAGSLFMRQAMIRWTQPFTGGSFMFALENPSPTLVGKSLDEEDAWSTFHMDGSGEYMPDFIARINYDAGIAHFSAAGMVRELIVDDGVYDDSEWGAAVSLNANINTFGKDHLHLEVNYGNALGRYMEAEFADAFLNPVTHDIELSDQWGGFVSYHHFWTDALRSSIVYSLAERDNDLDYVTDAVDKKYQSVHANLIWSPVARVNIGVEYIWGYREVENGEDGDMNRVQTAFQYKF